MDEYFTCAAFTIIPLSYATAEKQVQSMACLFTDVYDKQY